MTAPYRWGEGSDFQPIAKAQPQQLENTSKDVFGPVIADQLSPACVEWLMRAVAMGLKPELAALRRAIAARPPELQQKRLFSSMEIRSVDSDLREITGLCSTNRRDRVFDRVEPRGMLPPALPLPLLMEHDTRLAVGLVPWAEATDHGVMFRAQIPRIPEPPSLRDRIEEVWAMLKAKPPLLRSVSIGFIPRASTPLANGGRSFSSWELTEISLCQIPMNVDAAVYTVRAVSDV